MMTIIYDPLTESSIAWLTSILNVRVLRLRTPFCEENLEDVTNFLIRVQGNEKQVVCLSCTSSLKSPYNSFKKILDLALTYPTVVVAPSSFEYSESMDRRRSARLTNKLVRYTNRVGIGLLFMKNINNKDRKPIHRAMIISEFHDMRIN